MNKPYPIIRIFIIVLIIVLLVGGLPLFTSRAMGSIDNSVPTPTLTQVIPTEKIDPNVLRLLQEHPDEKVSIIVYMAKQDDLSQQAFPKGPTVESIDQQREAVFQTLTQTAANTQGPVMSVLQSLPNGAYGVKSSDIESFWIFNGLGATADRDTILELAAMPEVGYIYEDMMITIPPEELQSEVIDSVDTGETALPWNLTMLHADRVWNELGYNGKGIVVGIIDTGVDLNHPALKNKYRGNHTYQVYSWHDYVDSSKLRPYDDQGHGTHVTGIILGDDGAGDISGVAPGAEWIAAKAIDAHGQGFARALMRAMQWMMAPEGIPSLAPDVVNNSWGGPCGSTYFRQALEAYRSAGIVPIFAAGNYGPGAKSMAQPACLPEAISVGAIDENNTVLSFSSRGPSPYGETKPELTAPGANIRSTFPNGLYAIKKGTSMAAPHATGVVALIRQAFPKLTVDDIENRLLNSAVDLGPAGADNDYGTGRVDAYRAVSGIVDEPPPGEVTLVSPSGNINDRQPTFTWNTVSGAASYTLKINDLAAESSSTTHQAAEVCSGATCSVKITSDLAGWAYTWQVQASNSGGDGPWSDTMSFTVSGETPLPAEATLVSPQGTISETLPIYKWNLASDATRYQLTVNSTAGALIQNWYQADDICSTSACSVRPSTKLTSGAYTWRVQTSNSAGDGPWSDIMSFTVSEPVPGVVTLISPSGSITGTQPTYTWNGISEASKYQLEVNGPSGNLLKTWYQASSVCTSGSCTLKQPTALAAGIYSWRVQASSSAGDGPWSNPLSFTLTEAAPGAVTLVSPSGNTSDPQPTYTWNPLATATRYQLDVNGSSGNLLKTWYQAGSVCSITSCVLKQPNPLAAGNYSWRVQASNTSGDGPWSNPLSFTIITEPAPGTANLISPTGSISENQPTYRWNMVGGASKYQLRVNSASGNLIKTWYQASTICAGTTCSVKPAVTLTAGTFQWWVQPSGPGGDGPESAAMGFSVATPPAQTPTPVPPVNYQTYIVQPGDYLAKLAQQWGVNWIEIANLNNIYYPYIIYVGQVLKKPQSAVQPTPPPASTSTPPPSFPTPTPTPTPVNPSGETYIVQPGDYLAKLAQQWGVSWIEIANLNNLHYPYIIYIGQVLKKPGGISQPAQPPTPTPGTDSGRTYIVQPGDYLAKLAQQWGVSWQQIATLNNIYYPYIIYVGQVLKRP